MLWLLVTGTNMFVHLLIIFVIIFKSYKTVHVREGFNVNRTWVYLCLKLNCGKNVIIILGYIILKYI